MNKLFSLFVTLGLAAGLASSSIAAPPPVAEQCRQDLARRFKLDLAEVTVADCQAQTFSDTSLGLPCAGKMYAQVLVNGYRLLLKAGNRAYLYTAGSRSFRYGGPLDAWRYSALYLQPVPNEPNLNGNLYQVSLLGTNPRLVASLVTDFWPQADGSVLVDSRTSRSGFSLRHVSASGQVTPLGGAFAYGGAAVDSTGKQWAAFTRPMLGAYWQFTWGPVAAHAETKVLDLPPGTAPLRLDWSQERPIIVVKGVEKTEAYQMTADATGWEATGAYLPPAGGDMMLNKSETLVVKTDTVDGKPVTRVVRQWFTGDERPVAKLPDFKPEHISITPNQRFVLLAGSQGENPCTYTVDLASGEVLTTVADAQAQLFLTPVPTKLGLVTE